VLDFLNYHLEKEHYIYYFSSKSRISYDSHDDSILEIFLRDNGFEIKSLGISIGMPESDFKRLYPNIEINKSELFAEKINSVQLFDDNLNKIAIYFK
jgi:hypothetical protein